MTSPKTLTALEMSIHRWARKIEHPLGGHSISSCPLCLRFKLPTKVSCVGDDGELCPTYAKTGKKDCWGTSFPRWCVANADKDYIKAKKYAEIHHAFLVSLYDELS